MRGNSMKSLGLLFIGSGFATMAGAWSKTLSGPDDGNGNAVQQTADGGYVIAGSTESYGAGGLDVWLIKTDANGNEQWKRTFGGSELDFGLSAQQTSDGGYIFTGSTNSFGAGYFDVLLIKTDANGNWE